MRLKSDLRGIEMNLGKVLGQLFVMLKSDLRGIEMVLFSCIQTP